MKKKINQYNYNINKIIKILQKNYSSLGIIKKINFFKSNGSNSLIYSFKINNKNFLIKIIPDPNKIYGKKNGQKRISIITNIISKLSNKYNLEKFVQNDYGNYTTNINKNVIRVTEYIKPQKKSKNITLKSVQLLNLIHKEFWNKISKTDQKKLMKLEVPYNLNYTFRRRKKIKLYFEKILKKKTNNTYTRNIKKIISKFDFLLDCAKKAKNLENKNFFNKKTFTHNDFHPNNLIFDKKNNIILFDFDNIQYSQNFRCLYFFLLRFAFHKKKKNRKNFQIAFEIIKKNYYLKIPNFLKSLEFTLFVELEKILKILCRVSERNGLDIFIKKIIDVHLPNVLFLENLRKNEIQKSFK